METWHKMEWSDLALWNTEFCKKLTIVYRIIVANVQKIKFLAKGKKENVVLQSGNKWIKSLREFGGLENYAAWNCFSRLWFPPGGMLPRHASLLALPLTPWRCRSFLIGEPRTETLLLVSSSACLRIDLLRRWLWLLGDTCSCLRSPLLLFLSFYQY